MLTFDKINRTLATEYKKLEADLALECLNLNDTARETVHTAKASSH